MSNKKQAKTTAQKIGIVVFATIMVVALVFLFAELRKRDKAEFTGSTEVINEVMSHNGNEYKLKENIETVLLLGLDKYDNEDTGYNNDRQADFMLLLVVDNNAKTTKAIHVNRDSMAEMNVLGVAGDKIGTVTKQIALSHTYGNGREVSCRNAANAVSGLLMGVEIDHYVSVTMEAVPVYNDFVGGVTVEVLDDFTGIDDALKKGKKVTLKGEQALTYVRSRYGLDDPTNNHRMIRQKQYLEALYEKSLKLKNADETFIQNAGLKLTDYIVSDCSVNRLESILEKVSGYEFEGILNIEGETKEGERFMEFYPDENSVKDIVIDCFYEIKD